MEALEQRGDVFARLGDRVHYDHGPSLAEGTVDPSQQALHLSGGLQVADVCEQREIEGAGRQTNITPVARERVQLPAEAGGGRKTSRWRPTRHAGSAP